MLNSIYLDTEFIEGKKSPRGWRGRVARWLDRRSLITLPHTIQLVSIGLAGLDGRELYLISTDFNHDDADAWVKTNVLAQLPPPQATQELAPGLLVSSSHVAPLHVTDAEIAQYVLRFVWPVSYLAELLNEASRSFVYRPLGLDEVENGIGSWLSREQALELLVNEYQYAGSITPTFIADYGAYDWVVFCRLFGRMIDLPKYFPMYVVDLQQEALRVGYSTEQMGPRNDHSHDALGDALHNMALHLDMVRFDKTVLQ